VARSVAEATLTGAESRLPAAIARLTEQPEEARKLGPFVLVEQLGRGGFAPVWLAREVYGATTLRTAAVKLFALPQTGGAAERERARIIAEARALCRVEHPSVVRFYALPLDAKGDVMGLAMEHVAGTPLDRRLRKEKTLPVAEALAMGAAIASALAAVHRVGLVHRDVKPSNIVEASGHYKLIDFGIAGVDAGDEPPEPSSPSSERTQRVAVQVGTRGYIDPECVADRLPAEPVSDLYGLGATLFICLTGRLPASDGVQLVAGVLDGTLEPPPVASLAPGIPAAVAELVDGLLAPNRAKRIASAEWVAIRIEQIRSELGGTSRPLPPENIGPFRGLGRFESGDRDVYFGRSSEVAAALETLRGRGLVALLGPSGSGKSSLARAGLMPAVADGALGAWPPVWDLAVAEPGVDPRSAVIAALEEQLPDAEELTPNALVVKLAERAQALGRGTLLFVDQLEELATLSEAKSAAFVVDLLREIGARPLPGVRAVLAARRDLLDPLLAMTDLGKVVLRGSVLVEPLVESVWSDVIDRALGAYGYTFEDAMLRDEVLAELARTAEAMPLVQFALTELWNHRDREKKRLTRTGLTAIGGLTGALGRHADAILTKLAARPDVTRESTRALLLALTTARGTRSTRTRSELERVAGPATSAVLRELEAGRLVVSQAKGVTLAHDALISSWPTLRDWLAEEGEHRLLAEELERAARAYQADPTQAPLFRKRRLEDAERLLEKRTALSEEALAFLRASRRNERQRRWLAIGSAGLVLAVAGGLTVAYLRAVTTEQQKTAAALREEQASRQFAEKKTREVQEAQARIDQLLKNLAESPKKEEIVELQRRIRAATGAPEPLVRSITAPTDRRVVPAPPTAERPVATPAPAAPSTQPGIKVQDEW
jgi:serine/threonine protein kinase